MITQQNYSQNHHSAEKNSGVSQTVPGQVLPLREIISRYSQGRGVEVFAGGDDSIPPGLERLDKVERAQKLMDVKEDVSKLRKQLKGEAPPKPIAEDTDLPAQAINP